MRISLLPVVAMAAIACAAQGQTVEFARASLQGTGAVSGGGIACTNLFYTGWRFEVTGGPYTVREVGGHFFAGSGSVFAALVRLDGPNDNPDQFNLTGSDVVATTLVPLPTGAGGSREARASMTATLENGWYVILFGGGRFGATSNSGNFKTQDPSSATPGAQNNVTYRQPEHPLGQLGPIAQGSVVRVFVTADPTGSCAADFNADTVVDFFDYLDFVEEFAVGC